MTLRLIFNDSLYTNAYGCNRRSSIAGAQKEQDMQRTIIICTLAVLTSVSTAIAAKTPHPTISMARARAIALHLAPGSIISSEYEKEGGAWRYSFDIQQRSQVQEIGIDARTGRVVENKSEGKQDRD